MCALVFMCAVGGDRRILSDEPQHTGSGSLMCASVFVCAVGGDRRISPDQPQHDGSGSGTKADDV